MEEAVISKIIATSEKLIGKAKEYKYKRYLYEIIRKTSQEFFIGFYGMRGIGKTTLLLQLAEKTKDSVYFSADSTHLRPFDLYEIISELKKKGYKTIYVDEIQFKDHWKQDLKTIYDESEVRVIFTGSSAIDIKKGADLSRRVLLYELSPLTFSEYLIIKRGIKAPFISYKQLISKASELARQNAGLMEYLPEYLKEGGVAYPGTGVETYLALRSAVDRAISHDLAVMKDVDVSYQNLAYKFLYFTASSKPLEISYSSIANHLEISKNTAKLLVYYLERAGLVYSFLPCLKGSSLVRKEPKVLLPVPLRSYFNWEIGKEPDKGALREDFFVQHMKPDCYLKGKRGEKTPDYLVKGKAFEVGGASKTRSQNPDFLVLDGFPVGEKKIPLFLIGLINPKEFAIRSVK